jgi:hypothetical protein
MPLGAGYGLGTSPLLAIASGLARGNVANQEEARSAAEAAERAMGPKRERRRLQELARTQLATLDAALGDEAFDETRDYEKDLTERRALRRRAQAYRTVNPSASLEDAEAYMMAGPNAVKAPAKAPPRRTYDSTRGGYFDEDSGTFTTLPNLPKRAGTATPTRRAPKILTTAEGIFAYDEDAETLTPVKMPDGATAQPKPTGGRADDRIFDMFDRVRLGKGSAAPIGTGSAAPTREPLSDEEKRRARVDRTFRRVLEEEGYTAADWAAAPPGR